MAHRADAFEQKLQRAMERVRLVLQANRAPCFASGVHHQYQDKYMLAESMTNAALASQANAFATLGLSREQLEKMCTWSQASAVSLRFQAEERCTFLREEVKEIESATKQVVESSLVGMMGKLTSKTVTKVTEYFWKYETSYELLAFRSVGQQEDDQLSVLKREGEVELKTTVKESPYPSQKSPACNFEVNVSWLIKALRAEQDSVVPCFSIDRAHAGCHTPRRNPDIQAACDHFSSFAAWAAQVADYLGRLLRVQPDAMVKLDMSALNVEMLFVPILPLLEDKEQENTPEASAAAAAQAAPEAGGLLACLSGPADSTGIALSTTDTNGFLSEEARLLHEKRADVMKAFPSGSAVATAAEAVLALTLRHCTNVCRQWADCIDYIEDLLRKQLVAAIGKDVTPAEFADYMQFHNRKLFADAYAPKPFCFAVRRSEKHGPEGTLSIEQEATASGADSNIAQPIVTLVAHSAREHKMSFPLSASANVSFGGDKYLHAWLSHKFSGQTGASLSLVSRARQFSSFIVLVGRISSARTFDPKYAAIVQNKDELKIPLDLSTIPTPKEFKDAIESLSPEQQSFAKAFRSMQLESTLFGILVIQIKPQLEKVLNLPSDSLTKEIKLTQELMQLFIKYQIPSDLLAFDPDNVPEPEGEGMQIVGMSASEKLALVKGHVKAMYDMISGAQQEEVEQRRREEEYANPRPILRPSSSDSLSCDDEEDFICDEVASTQDRSLSFEPRTTSMSLRRGMSNTLAAASSVARSAASGAPRMKSIQSLARRSVEFSAAPVAEAAAAPMAGAGVPPPAPGQQQQQQQHHQPQDQPQSQGPAPGELQETVERDYTQVPKDMDESFQRLDVDNQLRPTIINPSGNWTKRAQKALLATPSTTALDSDDQKKEKDAAFDLLDALTKSGALAVDDASLHIVVAATHCFDKSVTETVIKDNVNPIDKVERSTLIMGTTIHQQPTSALIRDAQLSRVRTSSPMLFLDDASAGS